MVGKHQLSRRNLIKLGVAGAIFGVFNATQGRGETAVMPTPEEVEGPFYPTSHQKDKDADLTRVAGQNGLARGQHIIINGYIKDTGGQPVENAIIDIWQANAAGRYNHPRDPNPASLDPYFQGWAIIRSDKNGFYRFKTVKPGAYPASATWIRPPHIHFKISRPGYPELITQMYFLEESLNQTDLLFGSKNESEQLAMTALKAGRQEGLIVYVYHIVLGKP